MTDRLSKVQWGKPKRAGSVHKARLYLILKHNLVAGLLLVPVCPPCGQQSGFLGRTYLRSAGESDAKAKKVESVLYAVYVM